MTQVRVCCNFRVGVKTRTSDGIFVTRVFQARITLFGGSGDIEEEGLYE